MIHRVIPSNSIPTVGYAINASRGGRASMPVAPANYIYSHFKHVSGVPAPEGVRGVAITKLKVLDVLIEQLSRIKKQVDAGSPVSENQIDALIEQYENQLRQAKAANIAMPYNPPPQVFTGAVFNLVA